MQGGGDAPYEKVMATRRRYSEKTRAKAVGIAVVEGVTEAERQTGIPKQTIDYWLDKPEFGQLRTTAREVVVESLWVGIQIGIRALVEGIKGDAPLNHKADAFDKLAQRYALLNGEATQRTETHDWKLDDYETVERAAAVVVEELARRTDEGAAQAAVGPAGETGATSTEG
jgi:hypothetical protein